MKQNKLNSYLTSILFAAFVLLLVGLAQPLTATEELPGQGYEEIDYLKARDLYQRDCKGLNAASCIKLGEIYEYGRGLSSDFDKAAESYLRACEMKEGTGAGCERLGWLFRRRDSYKGDQYFKKASEIYWNICSDDDAQKCMFYGNLFLKDTGMRWDNSRAVDGFRKACELGEPQGCLGAANIFRMGLVVEEDYLKASNFYRRACDIGDSRGCEEVALLLERGGSGVDRDDWKAAQYYGKACKGGNQRGCADAAHFYKRACSKGKAEGCINVGEMYQNGVGVKQDYWMASKFCEKACDGGDPWGCQKAVSCFQKACDQRHTYWCFKLGEMYEKANGVAQNVGKATENYRKACNDGVAVSCEKLRKLSYSIAKSN